MAALDKEPGLPVLEWPGPYGQPYLNSPLLVGLEARGRCSVETSGDDGKLAQLPVKRGRWRDKRDKTTDKPRLSREGRPA